MIVCPSMSHFAAKILVGIQLEARRVASCVSMEVKDCLDLSFEVIKSVPIEVTTSLEAIITEPLKFEFDDNIMFYCVFHHVEQDVVYIPQWFPQVMIGKKGSTIEITNRHNMPDSQIKVVIPKFEMNKFHVMINQSPT
jgi:hypothetical protein